jgi:hypothetical protein
MQVQDMVVGRREVRAFMDDGSMVDFRCWRGAPVVAAWTYDPHPEGRGMIRTAWEHVLVVADEQVDVSERVALAWAACRDAVRRKTRVSR